MSLKTEVSLKLKEAMTMLENAEQSIEVRGTIKWLSRAEGAVSQITDGIEVPVEVEELIKPKASPKKKSK